MSNSAFLFERFYKKNIVKTARYIESTLSSHTRIMQRYNLFFYPNACHVCKRFGKGVSLKRCANCTMISYCSKEHQREHWLQHKGLCTAITGILGDNRTSSLLCKGQELSPETWTQAKMNFMLLVGLTMSRKLERYEEEMFKFLRACAICHATDIKILDDCPNCPCTSFCAEHKSGSAHKETCSLLNLSFSLDVTLTKYKPEMPEVKVPHFTDETPLPNDMREFIKLYVESQKTSDISTREEVAFFSEYLTRPLTLLFAMQQSGYSCKKNSLTIHVIASNVIEMHGFELWEILLHWLPSAMSIKVVFVGPELPWNLTSNTPCEICISRNKRLSIETYDTLYECYANSSSFSKADFIVGFNAGIHECEDWQSSRNTWGPSLRIAAEQNCPFILTSYTLQEAEREQIRLRQILGDNISWACCAQNPYSSLRPYRDFETNNVYYQNQFVLIYKDLNSL